MLRKSKQDDKGVKLEVNGRILDSCTDLMSVSWLILKVQEIEGLMVLASPFISCMYHFKNIYHFLKHVHYSSVSDCWFRGHKTSKERSLEEER